MKNIVNKILLISVLVILITFLAFNFSSVVRHQWGMFQIKGYPLCVDIIKSQDFITSEFRENSISTAPPLDVIWAQLIGSMPEYLMVIDVKGMQMNAEKKLISKKGRVQLSLSSALQETGKVSYTLSWIMDGISIDVFGLYTQ